MYQVSRVGRACANYLPLFKLVRQTCAHLCHVGRARTHHLTPNRYIHTTPRLTRTNSRGNARRAQTPVTSAAHAPSTSRDTYLLRELGVDAGEAVVLGLQPVELLPRVLELALEVRDGVRELGLARRRLEQQRFLRVDPLVRRLLVRQLHLV